MGFSDDVDLSLRLGGDEEQEQLERLGRRLLQLRLTAGGLIGSGRLGPPLCVLMEGWDAGGKGGAIKRLVAPLDARHVRVAPFAAPTPDEKRHHFLWRFVSALPGWGGMAVMDRTWYGRVLVERVEGFATKAEWSRAYGEIDQFERMLAEEGMVFLKIWLHISDEEQLKRFEKRAQGPAEVLEAHRRGLAQPREARGLRGGVRGHVRAHVDRLGAVAHRAGRVEVLRARRGHAPGGDRARGRASSCGRARPNRV